VGVANVKTQKIGTATTAYLTSEVEELSSWKLCFFTTAFLQQFGAVGCTKEMASICDTATTIPKSLLLKTGLTCNNSRKEESIKSKPNQHVSVHVYACVNVHVASITKLH